MDNKDINMLDRNGNKLLKPSPLKIWGAAIGLVSNGIKAFSSWKDKKAAKEKQKAAEKEKIAKEKQDIKGAKASGDKVEKAQSQKEISLIKSGRDDKYTGTVLSRAWHKGRAKRKAKKEAKLRAKNA